MTTTRILRSFGRGEGSYSKCAGIVKPAQGEQKAVTFCLVFLIIDNAQGKHHPYKTVAKQKQFFFTFNHETECNLSNQSNPLFHC